MDERTPWPVPVSENRPWTRWWWMGSALTEAEITDYLERFAAAGFGGVEVNPIYGPKGAEARFVPFLSPRWTELFAHTLKEARRLGLGVDMISGTGWPFGGPWVTAEDAAQYVWVESFRPDETVQSKKKPEAKPLAERTLPSEKAGADLRYVLFLAPTGQEVKRAAPGGDGNVLDHFDAAAVRRYLSAFDRAFDSHPAEDVRPRCFFNDSWEVFGANASPSLLDEFQRRRGYDLRDHLHHLRGDGDPETVRRVRTDYRETIHDLTLANFLGTWTGWAHGRGSRARNQAHGSPGNLLDLYAAADVPETEVFGPARLTLGGLERTSPYLPPDFGQEEEPLICRMASSAAHVAGRPFCSSESFTWLGEHGHVPLEHMKAEVDTLWTLGINHIFFHGTPFSPEDAAWPGWLFYAATHCAPTNPFWRDLPALNAYIARGQSLLQAGKPDADVLLYFPFHDLIAGEKGTRDLLQFLAFHDTATWLRGNLPRFCEAAHTLVDRGYGFDMVSDRQLYNNVGTGAGNCLTTTDHGCYRALLVAGCKQMPPETLERIAELAHAGATVLVLDALPDDVPGLTRLQERRGRLQTAEKALQATGHVHVGGDVDGLMAAAGIRREALTDHGIEWIRRRNGDDRTYFLSVPGRKDVSGWIPLGHGAASMVRMDPMTGASGAAAVRKASGGGVEVYLDLPAGASVLLHPVSEAGGGALPAWTDYEPAGTGHALADGWQVAFIEGGPSLPAARAVPHLSDWTTWDAADADALRAFSGTARYTLTFDLPPTDSAHPDAWSLELGRVCHAARVRLNGRDLGVVFARPWQIMVPTELVRPAGNTLEIEVTNLMANRIADLDRREGAAWRPFLLVNIQYKPFDAATWKPVPSGLVGPVALVPLRRRSLSAG